MKRILTFLFLTIMVSESGLAAMQSPLLKPCHQVKEGPPGVQGPSGISQSTAFGSFYNLESDHYDINESVSFPLTNSIHNITHVNTTEFVIQQSGYYYFNFGVTNHPESEFSSETVLSLYVDDVFEVPGSRLFVYPQSTLISTGVVVPLQAGQTVTLRNVVTGFDLGTDFIDPIPVTAYINMIRLAPL